MIGERHYVYQGWNYDQSFDGGKTWLYAYSWVYPFGQVGPTKITREWQYVAGKSLNLSPSVKCVFALRALKLMEPRLPAYLVTSDLTNISTAFGRSSWATSNFIPDGSGQIALYPSITDAILLALRTPWATSASDLVLYVLITSQLLNFMQRHSFYHTRNKG